MHSFTIGGHGPGPFTSCAMPSRCLTCLSSLTKQSLNSTNPLEPPSHSPLPLHLRISADAAVHWCLGARQALESTSPAHMSEIQRPDLQPYAAKPRNPSPDPCGSFCRSQSRDFHPDLDRIALEHGRTLPRGDLMAGMSRLSAAVLLFLGSPAFRAAREEGEAMSLHRQVRKQLGDPESGVQEL